MHPAISGKRFVIGAVTAALVAAGCGAGATPTPTGAFPIHLQLTPSHVSVAMAADQGLFKGIDVKYTLVGYGESSQLFHAGQDPIGNESPWEAAVYQGEGKDIRYFGTAEANNMLSGVIIRKADEAKYKTIADLKGQKIGHTGFGTGTWAAFQALAKGLAGLDAKKDMQPIEGGPGELEGLLQKGEVEAFISFTAPTAHALANPAYKMIYSVTDEWKKAKGHPIPINGWIADAKWLDDHLQIAKDFIAGADAGLEYLKKNLSERYAGKKYEKFAQGEGVLVDEATTQQVDKWILENYFYLPANVYTQAWADSVYEFVQMGEGVLVDKVPAKDKVFYTGTMYK
jgi:ABC-type nitrate/sulfonate/bicarbonate transport system substrate-binding protein